MTNFKSDGFLGDICAWTALYHRHFLPLLNVYRELNVFAQDVFLRCDVLSNDHRRFLAKSLFSRILGNFQAVYLLGERGMETEMQILARSLCEATFALVAIDKHESFAERYIQHSDAQSLQDVERLLRTNSEQITSEIHDELIKRRTLFKKPLNKKDILKPWEIAEIAGMTDIYLSTYALFSIKVHPSPRSLLEHFVKGDDSKMHIRFAPTHENSKLVLTQTMYLMTRCLGAMGNLFQLGNFANLNSFIERIRNVGLTLPISQVRC